MSRADDALDGLQVALVESFRQVLPDPALAVSVAELVRLKMLFEFAGQTLHFRKIPTDRNARIHAEREAGRTIAAIADQEHLTPRQVSRILKQCA